MDASSLVRKSGSLVEAMGRWPSFHDANVLNCSRTTDSCTVLIHIFEMTSSIDPKGYFVLTKHHLVLFAMQGVQSNSLPEPYVADTLSDLSIVRAGSLLQVDFESVTDQSGSVVCHDIEVLSVRPCSADGKART